MLITFVGLCTAWPRTYGPIFSKGSWPGRVNGCFNTSIKCVMNLRKKENAELVAGRSLKRKFVQEPKCARWRATEELAWRSSRVFANSLHVLSNKGQVFLDLFLQRYMDSLLPCSPIPTRTNLEMEKPRVVQGEYNLTRTMRVACSACVALEAAGSYFAEDDAFPRQSSQKAFMVVIDPRSRHSARTPKPAPLAPSISRERPHHLLPTQTLLIN